MKNWSSNMEVESMHRYILGVHSGHDSSVCLIKDCEIIYAIAKERLTRKKHDSGEPLECIEYVLEAEKISYNDIDLVVRVNWYNSKELVDEYYKRFRNVVVKYEHHVFHAYAVSLVMPQNSLIYVIDGRGCRNIDNGLVDENEKFESESLYIYKNYSMNEVSKQYSKHFSNAYKWGSHMDSIGYAYADVSRLIFNDYNAAGKIMALAAFGRENNDIPKVISNDNKLEISKQWLEYLNSVDYPISYDTELAKDIAYSLQKSVEDYLAKRVKFFIEKYKIFNVGISGGVALNCKNNGNMINKLDINELGIFPACGDDGIAIGAAVWALRDIYGDKNKIKWKYDLGKTYYSGMVSDEVIDELVELLIAGKTVGVFEGGSEIGPRALCNRSILAIANRIDMKDKLNLDIKKRESFRPFGGVVLEKNIPYYTESKIANDYMLSAVVVRDERKKEIPALVHFDGTLRVQVIRERDKERSIYKILKHLEEKYGEKILINTSFNGKNEPIVENPSQARKTAKEIGLDYLFIDASIEKVR